MHAYACRHTPLGLTEDRCTPMHAEEASSETEDARRTRQAARKRYETKRGWIHVIRRRASRRRCMRSRHQTSTVQHIMCCVPSASTQVLLPGCQPFGNGFRPEPCKLPEPGLALRAPISSLLPAHAAPVSLALRLASRALQLSLPHSHLRFASPASHSDAPLARTAARPYGADPPRAAYMACLPTATRRPFNGQGTAFLRISIRGAHLRRQIPTHEQNRLDLPTPAVLPGNESLVRRSSAR
jgi:hypothetical protein